MEEYHILNGDDTLVETDYDDAREIFEDSIDSRDIEVIDDLEILHREQQEYPCKAPANPTETNDTSPANKRTKYSFVWQYFRAVEDASNQFQCLLCHSCVGNQTSNLARHLASTHDITKQGDKGHENLVRIRPSRSFIWKYCTKEDSKHARCHLCNKVLYFGGGNTANITKHLRRLHANLIKEISKETNNPAIMDDETMQAAASLDQSAYEEDHNGRSSAELTTAERKERRGASYVWNYCEKLSRHTIRCKLCTKIMSFHGTANVITHLQRRHNVLGETGSASTQPTNGKPDINESIIDADNPDEDEHMEYPNKRIGRKSLSSASVVWKYCTRISQDQVRCCFCKKNLSYQGTSNLQRHLHRMHGVVTHGRLSKTAAEEYEAVKEDQFQLPENIDFIWQFCTQSSGNSQRTKCNMCDAIFDTKDTEAIVKHLAMIHSVETNPPPEVQGRTVLKTRKRTRPTDFETTSDDGNYDDYYDGKWSKMDENSDQHITAEFDEGNIKKDESLYDDIIVEDHTNYDEEPFDPSLMQDMPQVNPLSPRTSRADSPNPQMSTNQQQQYLQQHANSSLNLLPPLDIKTLQKLQEDRLRMETEYFREKAGFYRMQKYLTALQAKKVRVELERLHQEEATVVTTADLNGAYAVEVALPEHHITTQ